MRTLVIALSVLAFVACKNSAKVNKAEGEITADQSMLTKDSLALSFERTLCFGACPAYKIMVNNKGEALYEGYKFTEKIGKYKASLNAEQFNAILTKANEVGYFEMAEKYDNEMVTDLPSTMLSISGEKGVKSIVDRMNAPDGLKELEKAMDRILLGLDWQKAE